MSSQLSYIRLKELERLDPCPRLAQLTLGQPSKISTLDEFALNLEVLFGHEVNEEGDFLFGVNTAYISLECVDTEGCGVIAHSRFKQSVSFSREINVVSNKKLGIGANAGADLAKIGFKGSAGLNTSSISKKSIVIPGEVYIVKPVANDTWIINSDSDSGDETTYLSGGFLEKDEPLCLLESTPDAVFSIYITAFPKDIVTVHRWGFKRSIQNKIGEICAKNNLSERKDGAYVLAKIDFQVETNLKMERKLQAEKIDE